MALSSLSVIDFCIKTDAGDKINTKDFLRIQRDSRKIGLLAIENTSKDNWNKLG